MLNIPSNDVLAELAPRSGHARRDHGNGWPSAHTIPPLLGWRAQSTLLETKLRIPRLRARHVARARLLSALDEALHARLTLVAAPAGFGKTTLLTDWLASRSTAAGLRWIPTTTT